MNKTELRKLCKEKIDNIPPEGFTELGEKISDLILKIDAWTNACTVFVFVSMKNEIDTSPLLKNALKVGKRLCVPKITGDGTMDAVEINNLSELESGKFGISEPIEGCPSVKKDKIDLVLLPCLAADEQGNRLGKGGGFYDRFCEKISCKKIILCPELLLMKSETIPTEAHDITADTVATETRIIKVRKQS